MKPTPTRFRYLNQILIGFDQLVNAFLGGFADETLSARAYRQSSFTGKRYWRVTRFCIDSLFFWEKRHCYQAFLSEVKRKHLPDRYRHRYSENEGE